MNISKIKIVAIFGALAVILGAFGAHALKPLLNDAQTDVFRTATLYHFVHLMPMLVIAFLPSSSKVLHWSFYLFLAGIICFSGSLYLLSTKHLIGGEYWNIVGPITPLGGLLFIAGWLNLIFIAHGINRGL
jgi:uncharacterized membrane protein YgdD (TMEM256/DUF423 family)